MFQNTNDQQHQNSDAAVLQSTMEIRGLQEQLTASNAEISRLNSQLSTTARENERLKRELVIFQTNSAGARDASLLAETQLQLVESNAKVRDRKLRQ